jgi:hypothetical protein
VPQASNEDLKKVETSTAQKVEEVMAEDVTHAGDTPTPQFSARHSRLEKLTSDFAPAFLEPEPDLLYDLGQDLSDDLREHI